MLLEQIGQKLKVAREAQGISLRQIYERTKIPMGHLQSIDGAVTDDLPEPVYVAGYIKRYADCVGLDGQALSEEYRRSHEESAAESLKGAAKHSAVQMPAYTQPEYTTRTKIDRGPPTFKTFYFNAFWIVVVIALVTYLVKVQLNNQATQMDPSLAALREATTRYNPPAGAPAQATADAQAAKPADSTAGKSGDAHVTLSASQHVWVEVKSVSSGESLYTGYLEQAERRDFQDAQGLRVRSGNGGSVTVDFQGKISTLGEAGKVTERTFLAQSASPTSEPAKPTETHSAAQVASSPKPTTGTKKSTTGKSTDRRLSEARERNYRYLEDVPSRQYIPGESVGGTRSVDVPYRYSEGRLDAD